MKYEVVTRPTRPITPKVISLDTEYSELDVKKAKLLSISVGISPDFTYILENFKSVQTLIDSADIILTWNGVVDHFILTKSGFNFPKHKMIDGMLLEHLFDERLGHSLGEYALREHNDNYKSEFWSKYDSYQEAPKEEAYQYEMRDGCYTYRAGLRYLSLLKDKAELVTHTHKLQWALFDTEIKGIRVDVPLMVHTKQEMGDKIQSYLPKLRSQFNEECNLWELSKWEEEISKRSSDKGKSGVARPVFKFTSDRQVSDLVFGERYLNIPYTEKTKKGSPSTSFDSLKALTEKHPELSTLVEYKEVKAVYSTFVVGALDRVENGRLHPHFNPNGTTTGRLSSSNPNFQNMPKEGVIRNFILPEDGDLIIGADFSSLEAVIEGNLTEDSQLLKIILEGADKHQITAQAVGMSRNDAKTLNYLCQYGGGVWKIQKTFGVSEKTAQEIYDKYWSAYSGVHTYKQKVFKELSDTNQVTNIFGRTRHFNAPKNEYEKAKFERQAYSHMVQGPGGDMNNRATYLVSDYFKERSLGRMLIPVHDELVCSVHKNRTEEGKEALVRIMESTNDYLKLKYPVKAKAYGGFDKWQKT